MDYVEYSWVYQAIGSRTPKWEWILRNLYRLASDDDIPCPAGVPFLVCASLQVSQCTNFVPTVGETKNVARYKAALSVSKP